MLSLGRYGDMTRVGQSASIPLSGERSRRLGADVDRTVALTPLAAAFLTIAQLGVVVIARMFFAGEGRLVVRRTR
jgi:hypothetical protein